MSLHYLLDTDICIYITKKKPGSVFKKLKTLKVGTVGMSVVTYGELLYGIQKSEHQEKTFEMLEELVTIIPPLPMSNEACHEYAKIRASLEKNGKIIGGNDLWIAAHALSLNLILVTNNVKEFSRIPKLKIENWV